MRVTKIRKHDFGPNLISEFKSILIKNNVPIELVDKNHIVKINNKVCLLKYSNSSIKTSNPFIVYFWGVSKDYFEHERNMFDFIILIGGRNIGKKARNDILKRKGLSQDEIKIISRTRVEHVFIFPFSEFNQFLKDIIPTKGQVKIVVYINTFNLVIGGRSGSDTYKISGVEIKKEYLNRFEKLGIRHEISDNLRKYLKSIENEFGKYYSTVFKYYLRDYYGS